MSEREGYFVTHRAKCVKCDGVGVVEHPAWAEYYRQEAGAFSGERKEIFWFDLSFPIPPEEIDCSDCGGQGYITSEVALADALVAMDMEKVEREG